MKFLLLWQIVIALVLSLVLVYCKDQNMPATIQEVKAKHEERILSLPGVVSMGVGKNPDGSPVIIIGLDRPHPQTEKNIPKILDGYPVRTEITGSFKALD